ncbi:MAG TPA: FCD domain-containing protein [Lacipirellulaceae bacterium]|nr:FCD domain-containing protein [Lacipirellulaceae bacterium]
MEESEDVLVRREEGVVARFCASRGSIVDRIYDKILTQIIVGEVQAGEVLTCTRLAEQLGVSRTPVVGALERMVCDGILVKEKNQRARVKVDADSWLLQIHHLREIIEPAATELAALKIPDDVLCELQELAAAAEPNSTDGWQVPAREFDYALHLSIADHSQNQPLRESIYRCWRFKHLSYRMGCANPELEEIGYLEHVAILSALARRDARTASVAMLFHLRSSLNLTRVNQVV